MLRPPLPGTPAEDRFSPRRVGLDHLSLRAGSQAELDRLVTVLRRAGSATTTTPDAVNFRDPDGIAWELTITDPK